MSNWSQGPMFGIPYDDSLAAGDRRIAELLAQRERDAGGTWRIPPREAVLEWAAEFGIDPELLVWMFRTFTKRREVLEPSRETGTLRAVIPILKSVQNSGCTFTLTHSMQHQLASIVHLDVRSLSTDRQLQVGLTLDVASSDAQYSVGENGRHGGGASLSASFLVKPALPDSLEGVSFALVPTTLWYPPVQSLVVEDPVYFD